MTDDILKQIDLFLKNPEFNLENISTLPTAAKYLGMWVIAVDKYAKMYRYDIKYKLSKLLLFTYKIYIL